MVERGKRESASTGDERGAGDGPIVGVLAIQGDVEKHLAAIERCGARGRRVRTGIG